MQGSEKLQELLFFRTRITESIPIYDYDPKGHLVPDHHANPLLIFTEYSGTVFSRYLGIPGIGVLPEDKANSGKQSLPLIDTLTEKFMSSWAHPTASWKNMHLCNPSTTHVIVALDLILPHRRYREDTSPWSEDAVDWRLVHNPAGVRAGHVFELAFQLWKYHEGRFVASVRILAEQNGPGYEEAVDVIHKTEIGRTKINGRMMELMRLDQWRCDGKLEIAEE